MGKLETSVQQTTGLGITAIQVGKKNNMKVMAEEAIPVVFTFNRPFITGETAVVQCHAYEEKFDLHHTIGTYTLTMTQREQCPWIIDIDPPVRETNPIHINFPEVLAGATVNLMFSLQYSPQGLLLDVINMNYLSRKVTVEVLSSQGGPKIEAVYWCDSKGIKFGELSTPHTAAIVKNEIVYLHIHTRGLFGKQVLCRCNATGSRLINIRDNVAVETYFFFDDTLDTIELDCYPLGNNMLELVKDKISAIPLPYIKEGELQITSKTMQVFGQPGSPRKKQYASKAKCRVDIRPTKEYDGSFGFSWYRVGDMNQLTGYQLTTKTCNRTKQVILVNFPCNDQPFSDKVYLGEGIMGKHWETENSNSRQIVSNGNNSGTGSGVRYDNPTKRDNFIADEEMAERHKADYVKISLFGFDKEPLLSEYLCPVMTLKKGHQAKLKLFVHVKEIPKEILFVFDNPTVESEYLSVKADPIIPSSETQDIPHLYDISLECKKVFDKEIRLKFYSIPKSAKDGMIRKENGRLKLYPEDDLPLVLPELCGMLRILPNDDAHWRTIDVVFINVITNINDMKSEGLPNVSDIIDEEEYLRNYYCQAFIKIQKILTIPLDITSGIVLPSSTRINENFRSSVHSNTNFLTANRRFLKAFHPDRTDELATFLNARIYHDERFKKYKEWHKIFFINELCLFNTGNPPRKKQTSGFHSTIHKFSVVFAGRSRESASHELGHSLDLPHTFDGNSEKAQYTYEDGKTDNIMDYSHAINVKRKSFFEWQWYAINTNLKK